jgi:hypothetical protein
MAGGKWAQKVQLGREATPGTAVAATAIWRGPAKNLSDNREVEFVDEQIGIAVPTDRSYIGKVGGGLAMAPTPATFEQLPHLLEAGIKLVGTGVADGVGTGKIYDYPVGLTAINTIRSYTIESGDNQQAEEMEYSFVEKFVLSGERGKAVMMSGDWIGRQVINTSFTGALTAPTVEDIRAQIGSLYIDAAGGTIGTTQVNTTLLAFNLAVTTGWRAKWTLDSGQLYFNYIYFDPDSYEAKLGVTYEHNGTAVTEKTAWRNQTSRLVRLLFTGSALGTAGTHASKKLILDLAGKYEKFDALDADDGNSIVKATFSSRYNATAAAAMTITVVNELAAIP